MLSFKNIHENFYYRVFRVADYESDVRFSKFKMAAAEVLLFKNIPKAGYLPLNNRYFL